MQKGGAHVEAAMYSYKKLRGRIVERFGSQTNFAEKLGISATSLSKKMQCKTGFSQEDIEKWAELLDINRAEFSDYFFA